MQTLPELDQELQAKRAAHIGRALRRNGYSLGATAQALEVPINTLRTAIMANDKIAQEYRKNNAGRGRPKKST